MSGVTEYLKIVSDMQKEMHGHEDWKYRSYEELVLAEGREFEVVSHLPYGVDRGEMRECYRNSVHGVLDARHSSRVFYCEGYAASAKLGIPVQHAWIVDEAGLAYDPTWAEGGTYFGIAMEPDWALMKCVENGYYGLLCNDYLDDFALLREGVPARHKPRWTAAS